LALAVIGVVEALCLAVKKKYFAGILGLKSDAYFKWRRAVFA